LLYAHPIIPPTIIFIGLGLEIILIAALSKLWGVSGAAFGFLIVMLVISFGRLIMLKRKMGINVLNSSYLPPLGFAVLLGLGLLGLQALPSPHSTLLALLGVGAGLAGFVFLILTFSLTKSDRVLWKAVMHKRARNRRTAC